MKKMYVPMIIIGAPRSGTNMLRDVLTSLPNWATWPCDEINYIWRHGNVQYPSDEFTVDMARPEVCQYIRRKFDWVARKYKAQMVVEKTCANSLRVGFVNRVVPEARYIFIRRDGIDAVASAMKRWKAEMDILYLARKARFVPMMDLPYYGGLFLWNRFHRILSREERLAFWGPKLDGMEMLLKKYSLEEVCALQWKRCVDKAAEVLLKLTQDRWIEVEYERFVTEPEAGLKRVLDFLGYRIEDGLVSEAVADVSAASIGKGKATLGDEKIQRILPHISDIQQRLGYV
jgi:hypothetical protein